MIYDLVNTSYSLIRIMQFSLPNVNIPMPLSNEALEAHTENYNMGIPEFVESEDISVIERDWLRADRNRLMEINDKLNAYVTAFNEKLERLYQENLELQKKMDTISGSDEISDNDIQDTDNIPQKSINNEAFVTESQEKIQELEKENNALKKKISEEKSRYNILHAKFINASMQLEEQINPNKQDNNKLKAKAYIKRGNTKNPIEENEKNTTSDTPEISTTKTNKTKVNDKKRTTTDSSDIQSKTQDILLAEEEDDILSDIEDKIEDKIDPEEEEIETEEEDDDEDDEIEAEEEDDDEEDDDEEIEAEEDDEDDEEIEAEEDDEDEEEIEAEEDDEDEEEIEAEEEDDDDDEIEAEEEDDDDEEIEAEEEDDDDEEIEAEEDDDDDEEIEAEEEDDDDEEIEAEEDDDDDEEIEAEEDDEEKEAERIRNAIAGLDDIPVEPEDEDLLNAVEELIDK